MALVYNKISNEKVLRRTNMKDNVNTRKCYLVESIDDSRDLSYEGEWSDSKRITIDPIEFMDLKEGDKFILYEEDKTMVTWDDGKFISVVTSEPRYKTINGLKVKTVDTDDYDFPYKDFSIYEFPNRNLDAFNDNK